MSRMLPALAAVASLFTAPLFAATITVNSNADTIAADANCTLREAITSAVTNSATGGCAAGAAGLDTIVFAIGSGAQTITLTSPLPAITEATIVDATTQPGYAGTPLITVTGGGAVSSAFLLQGAGGSTIRGFALNAFTGAAIDITSSNNLVEQNSIGTNAAGTTAIPNGTGITVTGSALVPADGNVIRSNIISGNAGDGILLIGAQATVVQLNQIGNFGVGNAGSGVRIESALIRAANGNVIGASVSGGTGGNTFINNGASGAGDTAVDIVSGTGNLVVGNSMSFNGIPWSAIDLGDDELTPNDACDGDVGANELQNAPVLTHAIYANNQVRVRGSLNSTPLSTFTIDFYWSAPGAFPQGTEYIGSTSVTTDAGCVAAFDVTLPYTPSIVSGSIDATATNSGNNTSEQHSVGLMVPVTVAKSFTPNAIVRGGTPSVSQLQIAFTYPIASVVPTGPVTVSFTDLYPAGIVNAAVPAAQSTCGGTVTAAAGGTSVAVANALAEPGTTCFVRVNVTATQDGALLNEIPAGTVTATRGGSMTENITPASATLNVTTAGPPAVTKTFSPSTITLGETSTLTITLSNPHTSPLNNVSFVDTYPANLVNATPSNVATTCGGTALGASGGNTVSLSGGTLAPGASCTVTVSVTPQATGSISNMIPAGSITTTQGQTNDQPATGVLVVNAAPGPPAVTKAFTPSTITLGDTSTLTITINNPHGAALTNVSFVDTYPANLVNATPSNVATTCGGTVVGASGTNSVSLTGGTLAPGASCTVTVTVMAQATGSISNTIPAGSVITTEGQTNDQTATGVLVVNAAAGPPVVTKAFTPSTITLGETSTLTITINNPHGAALTNVSLVDTYPANLVNATPSNVATTCGGTALGASGTNAVSLTGGTLAPGGSCTVTVTVLAQAVGSISNTIPAGSVTTTEGQTNDQTATGVLVVNAAAGPPVVTKAFTPSTITLGDTSTLTITINNPHGAALTNVSFVDTYPANLLNATPSNVATTCGGTVLGASGTNSLSLTGGTVAPGGSCTVTVTVTARGTGPISNTIPAGSVITNEGETNDAVATGVLVVNEAALSDIPTASEWALLMLAVMLGTIGLIRMRLT